MLCFLLVVLGYVCASDQIQGWNYISLHCRDNENTPVDWWVLYKPPMGEGRSWESGQNFTYITSEESGKWMSSEHYITGNSMLQHTLSPLFRNTYRDHLAVLEFQTKQAGAVGSPTLGLLLADEIGGLWMGHTVPKLLTFEQDRDNFPVEELENGHLIMCLSLELVTLNSIARTLLVVKPEVVELQIPKRLTTLLPDWLIFTKPDWEINVPNSILLSETQFTTNLKSVSGIVIGRPPKLQQYLYEVFAKDNKIFLDVYGRHYDGFIGCSKDHGVRKIDAISLTFPTDILYVENSSDYAEFAVSTAARWQSTAGSKDQYWVCTGAVERKDNFDEGGYIMCIQDYHMWRSFDMLKIKEPEC